MKTTTSKPRTVRCPTCGGLSLYGPQNPYRPFCSQRCKLQDLGAWASERYRFSEGSHAAEVGDTKPPQPI